MNFKKVFILFISFLLIGSALGCELTKEYIEARNDFAKQIRKPYSDCIKSVSTVEYWYRFSQCFEAAEGKGISTGCTHYPSLPREPYESLKISDDFCSVFDFSNEKKIELMDQHAKDNDIIKCK